MEPYDANSRLYPQYVDAERINAIFLDQYIFRGKYPVHTQWPRDNISLPVGIYVANPRNNLKMVGLDYFSTSNTANFLDPNTHSTPWITHGAVADGDVFITVIANDLFLRNKVFGEVMSAYFSHEGRCWFSGRQDIVVHGYNVVGNNKLEFDSTLGGKTHYLYTATLDLRFFYDVVTTKMLNYIEGIKEYVVLSFE